MVDYLRLFCRLGGFDCMVGAQWFGCCRFRVLRLCCVAVSFRFCAVCLVCVFGWVFVSYVVWLGFMVGSFLCLL